MRCKIRIGNIILNYLQTVSYVKIIYINFITHFQIYQFFAVDASGNFSTLKTSETETDGFWKRMSRVK